MSRYRVYIKPFDSEGNYASEFTEVTDDVELKSLQNISQQLDTDEYNVGVFKFNDFALALKNDTGNYSEADSLNSIFKFKRADSLVKLTWDINDVNIQADVFEGTFFAGDEVEVFEGLLSDQTAQSDIQNQNLNFRVLGLESIFDKVQFPFGTVSNGDTLESAILDALNQSKITELLTVDASNISVDSNITIDDKTDWENVTVKEFLDDALLMGNAILYVRDATVYVSPRVESAETEFSFYGQASPNGIENIKDLKNIRSGINKTFNFWTWDGTSLVSSDASSIAIHGVRKKGISFSQITDSGKQQTILDNLKAEFQDPLQEFDLTTPLNYQTLDLFFLDKIQVDYPTVYFVGSGESLPLYGVAIYGESKYPFGEFTLTIDPLDRYKIMGRTIDTKNHLITFKMRKV